MGWELLEEIPADAENNYYTDVTPPLQDSDLYYIIESELTNPCNSPGKGKSKNTVRSNSAIAKSEASNISRIFGDNKRVELYPNPNRGEFNIHFNYQTDHEVIVRILNIQGSNIGTYKFNSNKSANWTGTIKNNQLVPGVYYIQIINNGGLIHKAFVVE